MTKRTAKRTKRTAKRTKRTNKSPNETSAQRAARREIERLGKMYRDMARYAL